MKISQKGVDLLKQFEGLELTAYQDVGGTWTIGHGQTYYEDGTKVKKGDVISLERAEQLYRAILPRYEDIVNRNLNGLTLLQSQFDALVSFAYNLGEKPTQEALDAIRTNTFSREFMLQYVHAGGKRIQGLVNRRNKEADLFYSETKVETIVKEVPVNNTVLTNETPIVGGIDDTKAPLFSFKTNKSRFEINGSSVKFFIYAIAISLVTLTYMKILPTSDYMTTVNNVIAFYLGMKVSGYKG
mgnify:CR=1 FL=1